MMYDCGLKVGDKVKVHIKNQTTGEEVKTNCADTIFDVYEKNGKLGIDYMKDSTSSMRIWYDETGFVPLESFSTITVTFEKMEA